MPRRALLLFLAAIVSWVAAAAFVFYLDPELALTKQVIERKRAWAGRCDARYAKKVVVYGGSSCAFSIDGERLEERYALPTVNMAAGAGLGAAMLTQLALPACREGDTLVVALEPALITRPATRLMSATHLAYALGERELLDFPGHHPGLSRFTRLPAELLNLRPDGSRTCALLGKLALRQRLYHYRIEEVEPSGYQWTDIRLPISAPAEQGLALSADARELLAFLQRHTAERHQPLRYSLPWTFCPADLAAQRRRLNVALIREIGELMPVLRDPALGVQTDTARFADSVYHLTREAARLRTDALGEQLTHDHVWTEASLAEAEAATSR